MGETVFSERILHARGRNQSKACCARQSGFHWNQAAAIIDYRKASGASNRAIREQHFASMHCWMTASKLVTLMGKAGTGKTLLAMAAVFEADGDGSRVPAAGRGPPERSRWERNSAFLPGSLEEKAGSWMQPIHDALEMLSDLNMGHEHRRSGDLMRSGSIVVEALSYIAGAASPINS